MLTLTRLLGAALVGGLALATWLFLAGNITLPSSGARAASVGAPDELPGFSRSSITWIAPHDAPASQRLVSEDGSHAVIVSTGNPDYDCGLDERPAYILLRRPEGRPAEPWSRELHQQATGVKASVAMDDLVEPGDTVLARGHLPLPNVVSVLDDGGFVLANTSGRRETLVLRFDANGELRWSHTNASLFGTAWETTFPHQPFILHATHRWQSGLWVDEAREQLVILAWDDRVVTIALADGRAVTAEATLRGQALGESPEAFAIVTERFARGDVSRRVAALEFARRRGWAAAMEPARSVLRDEGAPEDARLHAALLLADHGDFEGRDLVVAIAQRPLRDTDRTRGAVELAWRHLGRFLGEESIPLYVERLLLPLTNERMLTVDGEVAGLAALGDAAISPAVDLVLAAERDSGYEWRLPALLARLRAEMPRDERRHVTGGGLRDEELAHWDEFFASGEPAALQGVLVRQKYGYKTHLWSVLVLPAARWARLHPRPEYAATLRDFREAFAADPQSRDGWRDRVLAEVDAALAACGG